VKDPMQRLGAASYAELKAHPFFAGINWDRLGIDPPPPITPYPEPLIWQEGVFAPWKPNPRC